jgi:DNA-binding response OmpR family regulator
MGSLRNFKILLADDDPDDRELFTDAANNHNADVDSVPNGVQLMKFLSQSDELPDFIFLDLNMPEKGGKECLQEIRQHERLKHLPVIIYSTSSSKRDIDDTYDLGADLYITKPNSFTQLKNTVKGILEIDWSKNTPNSQRDSFVFLV